MAKRLSRTAAIRSDLSGNWQLYLLLFLLTATFAMGGGSRGDITSLVLLRPIAAICFGLGLLGLKVEQIRHYRVPFGFLAALDTSASIDLGQLTGSRDRVGGNPAGRVGIGMASRFTCTLSRMERIVCNAGASCCDGSSSASPA